MARGARKEGFSRRHRFAGRGSFAAALRSSRKLRTPVAILHVTNGQTGHARFGLALTRRTAARSVDRNRLKRISREAFRKHAVKGFGLDLVLAPRQSFSPAGEAQWLAELGALFDRIVGAC
jgi:ribonuclease P protein component